MGIKFFCITLVFSLSSLSAFAQDEGWVLLFDGETLEGWSQLGGKATYHIEDGAIVGTTVANTPNSFLTTDDIFSDFILEYEVKLSAKTNSGVQIRSNSNPEYKNGVVHGYQVEIDPSERAWTGGIYDEQRRGWLYNLEGKSEAQKAYRQGEWNKFRVEAIGDTLKTWVNGIPVSYLVDTMTESGFIGLQVHSIYSDEDEGIEIRWRNLRIIKDNVGDFKKETSAELKTIKQN